MQCAHSKMPGCYMYDLSLVFCNVYYLCRITIVLCSSYLTYKPSLVPRLPYKRMRVCNIENTGAAWVGGYTNHGLKAQGTNMHTHCQ